MSSSSGLGYTGLAPSGKVRITSRSQGSSAAPVDSDGASGRVLLPEPEVPGVLCCARGDFVEVLDVYSGPSG